MSSNSAENPTPIATVVSASTDRKQSTQSYTKGGKHHGAETGLQDSTSRGILEQQKVLRNGDGVIDNPARKKGRQQLDSRKNMHIPSPPTISNWHTMSTAATAIASNKQHSLNQQLQHERLPYMILPMVVPASRLDNHLFRKDVAVDDDDNVNRTDSPPVCEIQIPSHRRQKRRADADDDEDEDDDDDADTTTSTQNLSSDDHQQRIDYKGMYFTCQRQNYDLREQISCIHEDNRTLKRQLIEMQKQLYAHSRNKRPASSLHHPNHHQYEREVVPWSIPINTTQAQQDCQYQRQSRSRVLMVRHPRQPYPLYATSTENAIVTPTTPSKFTTTPNGTSVTSSAPLIPGITSSPSKGVSMSVSSEEGNTINY